jgi:hypothetical protein
MVGVPKKQKLRQADRERHKREKRERERLRYQLKKEGQREERQEREAKREAWRKVKVSYTLSNSTLTYILYVIERRESKKANKTKGEDFKREEGERVGGSSITVDSLGSDVFVYRTISRALKAKRYRIQGKDRQGYNISVQGGTAILYSKAIG